MLHLIARQGLTDALEIWCVIENIERQNHGRIGATLSERGAGSAGIVIRNSLISRVTIIVARGLAPIYRGKRDLHLRRAFDELLLDPTTRLEVEARGSKLDLRDAERLWKALNDDPRRESIEHFRHKFTAHLALPNPGIGRVNYGDFFDFARKTARVMEKLAHATGVTRERLDDHFEDFMKSAQTFWAPWDPQ